MCDKSHEKELSKACHIKHHNSETLEQIERKKKSHRRGGSDSLQSSSRQQTVEQYLSPHSLDPKKSVSIPEASSLCGVESHMVE